MFASDAASVRREIVAETNVGLSPRTTVSLHWKTAPRLDKELEQIVVAVAGAAKELWPHWYTSVSERFDYVRWPNSAIEIRLEEARKVAPSVSATWFRKAWKACQTSNLPVVVQIAAAEQLRQLSLALDPQGPLVLLLVSDADAPPTRIHTLARAAEWLATQAQVAVVLVVPEAWRGKRELDVVSYGALNWEPTETTECDELPLPSVGPRILVEPTIGVPHPASRAEQRLFEFLRQDPTLSGLFHFNRRVIAYDKRPYRVDLICSDHRIVVEIDGPDHNLVGLPGQDSQQKFINQLAMTLFSWIKKHPAKNGSLLGLLVIDEAKDFVPASKSVACRDNLVRLAAQARKYGLGLLFATQTPKSIDHNIVANCSTLLLGKQNSPAAIAAAQQLLQDKGSSGDDVAKLGPGIFYLSTSAKPKPFKITTSLCLSHHPPNPPDEKEVLERAKRGR